MIHISETETAGELDYKKLMERGRARLPPPKASSERFEIPKMATQIMGNRTFVKDFLQIAGILRRDPNHLLHYMSKEFGSFGHIENGTAIFIGKFGNNMADEKFRRYVKEYVLCHECGKPDTNLTREDRLWFLKCEACGAKKSVADVRVGQKA